MSFSASPVSNEIKEPIITDASLTLPFIPTDVVVTSTDATAAPIVVTSAEQHIADDIQPVLNAVAAVAPAAEVKKARVFLGKYAKGWVALAGTVATLGVQYLPIDSAASHVAQSALAIATVVGVIVKANAKD